MSQTLQYKGYDGSVLYSAEDKLLHGRILGIRDMVSFGGAGVKSLERNFKAAVDEYLAFCKAEGKKPNKPFKGSLKIRISRGLHQRAAQYAEEHEMKLNAVVQQALREYLAQAELTASRWSRAPSTAPTSSNPTPTTSSRGYWTRYSYRHLHLVTIGIQRVRSGRRWEPSSPDVSHGSRP
jgi:predicted HicB family RNase H-like nuclease